MGTGMDTVAARTQRVGGEMQWRARGGSGGRGVLAGMGAGVPGFKEQ